MEREPINNLLETTMQKIREMIGANSIVGEPISTPDGITLIPVSKLTFGFIGGGTDYSQKQEKNGYGGGTGAGVNIVPVAFLCVRDGHVDILYITPPPATSVDRIIDAVPEVIDKITDFLSSDKDNNDIKD